MLLLKELNHDNVVSLLGAGFLPDRRRFVALVSSLFFIFTILLRVGGFIVESEGVAK